MRKLYFIYDTVADNYVFFMDAPADAVAVRAFKHACTSDFTAVADDLVLCCLGELRDGNILSDHVVICKFKDMDKEDSNG